MKTEYQFPGFEYLAVQKAKASTVDKERTKLTNRCLIAWLAFVDNTTGSNALFNNPPSFFSEQLHTRRTYGWCSRTCRSPSSNKTFVRNINKKYVICTIHPEQGGFHIDRWFTWLLWEMEELLKRSCNKSNKETPYAMGTLPADHNDTNPKKNRSHVRSHYMPCPAPIPVPIRFLNPNMPWTQVEGVTNKNRDTSEKHGLKPKMKYVHPLKITSTL